MQPLSDIASPHHQVSSQDPDSPKFEVYDCILGTCDYELNITGHLNYGPLDDWPDLDHLNTELVCNSYPHCIINDKKLKKFA